MCWCVYDCVVTVSMCWYVDVRMGVCVSVVVDVTVVVCGLMCEYV